MLGWLAHHLCTFLVSKFAGYHCSIFILSNSRTDLYSCNISKLIPFLYPCTSNTRIGYNTSSICSTNPSVPGMEYWDKYSTPVGYIFYSCGINIPLLWDKYSTPVGYIFHSCGINIPLLWDKYSTPVGYIFYSCGINIPLLWDIYSTPVG